MEEIIVKKKELEKILNDLINTTYMEGFIDGQIAELEAVEFMWKDSEVHIEDIQRWKKQALERRCKDE